MGKGFSRCRRAFEFLGRHEILLPAFHRQQIADHLSGYGESGAVGVSFFEFSLPNHRQLVALPRSQFCGFDQHALDMLVALLGKRHAHHLVGRTPLVSAQATVADSLLDRPEAREVADFQRPGQCSDRTYTRNRPQSRQSLRLAASILSFFFLAAAIARSISGCATFTFSA
jgi:hypothetical protein